MAALPNDADLDIKSVFPEIVRGGGAAMLKSVVEVYSAKFEKAPPSPPPRPLSFAIWPPPATLLGGSRCRSRRGARRHRRGGGQEGNHLCHRRRVGRCIRLQGRERLVVHVGPRLPSLPLSLSLSLSHFLSLPPPPPQDHFKRSQVKDAAARHAKAGCVGSRSRRRRAIQGRGANFWLAFALLSPHASRIRVRRGALRL